MVVEVILHLAGTQHPPKQPETRRKRGRMRLIKLAVVVALIVFAWQWWTTRYPGDRNGVRALVEEEVCQELEADSEDCSKRIEAVYEVCSVLASYKFTSTMADESYTMADEAYKAVRAAAIRYLGGDEDSTAYLGRLIVSAAVNHACPELVPGINLESVSWGRG